MKNRKILLFSRDPGGANTVVPLVKPLEEKGYEVRLFGKDVALERYTRAGLQASNIMDFIREVDLTNVEEFLVKEKPDFIITGTSASDFTEKYLWKAAERLNIPSFAIIDQWMNYGIRFSGYQTSGIKEYRDDRRHSYLPLKILVMDDYARQEAIKDGLEPSRLIVTGQPYFETLLEDKKKVSSSKLSELRKKLDINDEDFIITFASEPVSKDYNGHYWGFTEKTIFNEIIEAVKVVSLKCKKRLSVVLKLHPREDMASYKEIIALSKKGKISIIRDKDMNPCDLILLSDVITGMSSMFLIEAVILDKPVLSILIGLLKENPFVLDRMGVMKSIVDRETLIGSLEKMIIKNDYPKHKLDFIKNPVSNVILHMERCLCQS